MDGMFVTLLSLSAIGGTLSGLLGIGGAVVMIPLMLAVPPWVGAGTLTMKQVAGISMLQVLAASISGLAVHRGAGNVNRQALYWVGFPMAAAALLGAWSSRYAPDRAVLIVFALLMLVALAILGLFRCEAQAAYRTDGVELPVGRARATLVGAVVGVASGMAGVGGGFMVIPLLVAVLRLPLKVAVGTSLGIVLLGSVAGAVGKVAAGQVEWGNLLPVVLGSVPAARLGARLSHALPSTVIRKLLLVAVALSLAKALTSLAQDG